MSGGKKKANTVILAICIVFLVLGIVGFLASSKLGEGELFWKLDKQTWQTVSLSCLNAGWIGALVVYWTGRRR